MIGSLAAGDVGYQEDRREGSHRRDQHTHRERIVRFGAFLGERIAEPKAAQYADLVLLTVHVIASTNRIGGVLPLVDFLGERAWLV